MRILLKRILARTGLKITGPVSWTPALVGSTILVSLLNSGLANGVPLLNEVFYDDVGSDAATVFTEIVGRAGAVMDGWTLVGVNGASGDIYRSVDLTGVVIPGDGLVVIATAAALGNVLAHRDFIGPVDWQNGPDAVQLRDGFGNVIDALQYGDAKLHNAGEGSPAPDVEAGLSLSRWGFGTDTDVNFADFHPSAPTPGQIERPVPEPGSVLFVAVGLLGLAVVTRSLRL